MSREPDQTSRLREKLEVLDGSRATVSLDEAAVRIGDIKELLLLAAIKTQSVASAPTADDFNSLLADIKQIHQRLNGVALVLQKKRQRR
tara:strand:+ start:10818 stop:11084 length:267 start_codon:yes stop_codon:yes gene_type:complete